MTIKAVIFDLDGTITEPFFDFDLIRQEMGLQESSGPVWEAMEKMTPQRRQQAEKILNFHEKKAVEQSKLNTGAKLTFSELRRQGIFIGVLTRNTSDNTLAVARKHGLEFDAVVGRDDGPVKPDSFGVLNLCKRFGVEPAETIVVGDYLFDMLCAKQAGAVAVLLANHKKACEFAEYADFKIEKIVQVLEIIADSA